MEIRPATAQDKGAVMDLCRAVYRDGDYVQDTWDAWHADGGTHIMWEGRACIGACNITTHAKQGWIEGMRIHPDFRRHKYGTALTKHAEKIIRDCGGRVARAFIDTTNKSSLAMSRKNGYCIQDTWGWYGAAGACPDSPYRHAGSHVLEGEQYVDSWRVYDVEDGRNAVFLDGSTAIIIPSRHFPGTTLVTVLEAVDVSGLASYLASMPQAAERGHAGENGDANPKLDVCRPGPGIHVVSRLDEHLFGRHFDRLASYHLLARHL